MKRRLIPLGTKFRRWTTISECYYKKGIGFCVCQCECGTEKEVNTSNLLGGYSNGCGCVHEGRRTHYLCNSRVYQCWADMKQRVLNPNREKFPLYAKRGVLICDEWYDFNNFYKWACNNGYDDAKTLDRIDNNGNYEPENCRWADVTTQQNNKSTNHLLTAFGETKTISQWVKDSRCVVKYFTLCSRMRIGWEDEEAITRPSDVNHNMERHYKH